MPTRLVNVLYIEDDAADADFAENAFKSVGCTRLRLNVVADGEAAARYLGIDANGPASGKTPDLVLLDLNIPRIHGKELLKLMKKSANLKKTPVVILSTSEHQHDIDDTYELGAAGYFSKPAGYDAYIGIFRTICEYWINAAALPS